MVRGDVAGQRETGVSGRMRKEEEKEKKNMKNVAKSCRHCYKTIAVQRESNVSRGRGL